MRGRTNAGGSGMLAINGDLKQFKVAEGETITAGDFVEYQEQINEYLISNSKIDMYKCKQISDNLAITVSGNALLLLKMEENKLKIIDSYSSKIVQDYAILLDGGIAVSVKTSPYIIKLKVENDLFVYVCGADTTGTTYNWPYAILEVDGILWAFNIKNVDDDYGKRKFYVSIRRFDISEYDNIIFLDEIINTYSSSLLPVDGVSQYGNVANTGTKCTFTSAIYVKENAYVIGEKEEYSNGYWLSSYFTVEIGITNDNIKVKTIDSTREINNQEPISFFDKYIFDKVSEDACRIYNAESGVKTNLNIEMGQGTNSIHWSKIGENRFALCEGYRIAVYEINKQTGEVYRLSEIIILTVSGYGSIGVLYLGEKVNFIFLNKDEKTTVVSLIYEKITGQIEKEVDTTSVKKYKGGKTIGVSNQSGTAGEKIDVYVPKV